MGIDTSPLVRSVTAYSLSGNLKGSDVGYPVVIKGLTWSAFTQ